MVNHDKVRNLVIGVGVLCAIGCGGGGRRITPSYDTTHVPAEYPGYSGSSSYETRDSSGRVVRRGGAVWSRGVPQHRVGLPRGRLTPGEIQRKFRQDEQYLRRQQRR